MHDRSRNTVVAAILGALLGPALFTPYLAVSGYRLGAGAGNPVLLLVSLAGLGASVAVAWRFGVRVAPAAVAVVALVAARHPPFGPPPDGATPVTIFAAEAVLLAATFPLAATVEWAVRNPGAARRWVTPEVARVALAAGAGHAALALGLRTFGFGFGFDASSAFGLAVAGWLVLGALLLGAVPAFAAARLRLVSPALVVAGCFAASALDTWTHLRALREAGVAMAATATTFTLYLLGWVAVLAVALLAGAVEHRLRERYGRTTSPRETASR